MARLEFKRMDEYLALPREPQPWIIKPIIPVGGLVNMYGKPKCLAIDTPIMLSDGTWETLDGIRVGDCVIGRNGSPTRVTAVHPQYDDHECYRVSFTDGSSIIADADHQWRVVHVGGQEEVTYTTSELLSHGVMKKSGKYPKYRWHIPLGDAVELPDQDLPIHPYLLGVWLGDGTECNSQITSADEEIITHIRSLGWTVTKQPANKYGWGVAGFMEARRSAGIIHKNIPSSYLIGNIQQRKDLLAGLLDTDGHAAGGVAEFYNTNSDIADGVEALARSLGYRVSRYEKVGTLYGQIHKVCHVVKIRAHEQVFKLKRKQDAFVINTERYQVIASIEPIESVPVKCMTVDAPDSLFRAGKALTLTHNTGKSFVAMGMAQAITNGDETWEGYDICTHGPVAYLQVDTPREEWAKRIETVMELSQSNEIPFYVADMWLIPEYPMDVLNPNSKVLAWLKGEMDRVKPILVIVDTLREIHSGDEDSSTVMRNVITGLVGACMPSEDVERPTPAIIFVSHARKDAAGWQDGQDDMMDQARGSSYVNGRMDNIVHITPKTMRFKGRATGEQKKAIFKDDKGWIHVVHEDDGSDGVIKAMMQEKPGLSVNAYAKLLSSQMGYSLSTGTRRIIEWQTKHKAVKTQ